jgi:hypothetical protein
LTRPTGLTRLTRPAGLTGLTRLTRPAGLTGLTWLTGVAGLGGRVLLLARWVGGLGLTRCGHRDGRQGCGDCCSGCPPAAPLRESLRSVVGRDGRAVGGWWPAPARFLDKKSVEWTVWRWCRCGRLFRGLHGDVPSPASLAALSACAAVTAWGTAVGFLLLIHVGDVSVATRVVGVT